MKILLIGFLGFVSLSSSLEALSEPVCVKTFSIVRQGPGDKFPLSWKVARYTPFLRKEKKGIWSRVEDLEGTSHWIKSSALTRAFSCAMVKVQIASLRTGPSAKAPLSELRTVDKFTPFKRLGYESGWALVEDETGRQAWIQESSIWRPMIVQGVSF